MPVRVVARRSGAGGSAVVPPATRKMAVVGTTNGKSTLQTAEALVVASKAVTISGSSYPQSIVRVSNTSSGQTEVYKEGADFAFSGSVLDFTNAPVLGVPECESVTTAATIGGGWPLVATGVGGVSIFVTAIDQEGTGETTVSNSVTHALASTAHTLTVQWSRIPFAGGYNVYYTTGGSSSFRLATVVGAATTSATVTGGTSAVTASTTNTTTKRPNTGQTVYVDYYYAVYDYSAKEYTNIADVIGDHGVGCDVTNAARLGFDNGASNIWIVAVSGSSASLYTAGIDKLANADVQYIVPLKSGTTVEQYAKSHAEYQSSDYIGKERFAVLALNNASEVSTVTAWGATFAGSERVIPVVTNKALYLVNQWQTSGGSYVDGPYQVAAHFFAAAVAGRICGLADSATPLTNSQILGFQFPTTATTWVNSEVRDTIEAAGVSYVIDQATNAIVYHGITNNTTTVESQEISVIAAEDELRKKLRDVVSSFRGKDRKITPERLIAIGSRVRDVLATLVKDGIIERFGEIVVAQDETTATKVWIRFDYKPIYPMNEIFFEYGFSTAPLAIAA